MRSADLKPCHHCTDRFVGCHATCKKEEYLLKKELKEKEFKARQEENRKDSIAAKGSITRKRRNPNGVFATHKKRG